MTRTLHPRRPRLRPAHAVDRPALAGLLVVDPRPQRAGHAVGPELSVERHAVVLAVVAVAADVALAAAEGAIRVDLARRREVHERDPRLAALQDRLPDRVHAAVLRR